jgi:hypothetical protein
MRSELLAAALPLRPRAVTELPSIAAALQIL